MASQQCEICEEEFAAASMVDGLCPECDALPSWPRYCCGHMYDRGEASTCGSCGESL